METLDLNEPVKSSEFTGSADNSSLGSNNVIEIKKENSDELVLSESSQLEERRKIVELSNESMLHGFDLAVQILAENGNTDAVKLLTEQRALLAIGLKEGIEDRIKEWVVIILYIAHFTKGESYHH